MHCCPCCPLPSTLIRCCPPLPCHLPRVFGGALSTCARRAFSWLGKNQLSHHVVCRLLPQGLFLEGNLCVTFVVQNPQTGRGRMEQACLLPRPQNQVHLFPLVSTGIRIFTCSENGKKWQRLHGLSQRPGLPRLALLGPTWLHGVSVKSPARRWPVEVVLLRPGHGFSLSFGV